MKLLYTPLISIIFCFFFSIVSFSQDEIKNYSPPDVSEGSNLLINISPSYYNLGSKDGSNDNELHIDFNGNYSRWRFTNRFMYAVNLNSSFSYDRNNNSRQIVETIRNEGASRTKLNGGLGYYFLKSRLFYAGLYNQTYLNFDNHYAPSSSEYFYPFFGYGRISNAERVTELQNWENVLIEEKIINHSLPEQVRKKLTEILDRRNNYEFLDKYKDNAEIEFFTQVEDLLINEGVINAPLSSRTALKLFQRLTNSNFIYFPKYKGCQFQAELESIFRYEEMEPQNRYFKSLIFSGFYGLPINIKTELSASVFLDIPLYEHISPYHYYFTYHSPLTIQEDQQMQKFYNNLVPRALDTKKNEVIKYMLGSNIFAFYNLTNTAGISANLQLGCGRKEGGYIYSIRTGAIFIYNILTSLQFYANTSFIKDFYYNYFITASSGLSYYFL